MNVQTTPRERTTTSMKQDGGAGKQIYIVPCKRNTLLSQLSKKFAEYMKILNGTKLAQIVLRQKNVPCPKKEFYLQEPQYQILAFLH